MENDRVTGLDRMVLQVGPRGPVLVPALAFLGPLSVSGQPMATGLLNQFGVGINAGQVGLITHGLGRVASWAMVVSNAPNFNGDIIVVSSTSTTAQVKVENQVAPGSWYYIT